MDKQELFNRVYLGLAKQGFKQSGEFYSTDNGEQRFACRYRGEGGSKCAVGLLLSEEAYSEALEGYSIIGENVQEAVCSSLGILQLDGYLYALLQQLQEIHDWSSEPKLMREKLHSYAIRNDLSIPSLEGEAK